MWAKWIIYSVIIFPLKCVWKRKGWEIEYILYSQTKGQTTELHAFFLVWTKELQIFCLPFLLFSGNTASSKLSSMSWNVEKCKSLMQIQISFNNVCNNLSQYYLHLQHLTNTQGNRFFYFIFFHLHYLADSLIQNDLHPSYY